MTVCEMEGEIVLSKIDPCGICGKRVGSNAVCCTLLRSGYMENIQK